MTHTRISIDSLTPFAQTPEDAGQAIDVRYAVDWENSVLIQRVVDRTLNHAVRYYRATIDSSAEPDELRFEPQNGLLPAVCGEWKECEVRA